MKAPSENAEQIAVVSYLRDCRPAVLFAHVANERRCSPAEGARLKAMGVRAGLPDLILFTPPPAIPGARGAFLELKSRHGGQRGPLQIAWANALRNLGYVGDFAEGAAAAVTMLKAWGYRQ